MPVSETVPYGAVVCPEAWEMFLLDILGALPLLEREEADVHAFGFKNCHLELSRLLLLWASRVIRGAVHVPWGAAT